MREQKCGVSHLVATLRSAGNGQINCKENKQIETRLDIQLTTAGDVNSRRPLTRTLNKPIADLNLVSLAQYTCEPDYTCTPQIQPNPPGPL